MTVPFSLMWSKGGDLIHGGSVASPLVFPVSFPGQTSLVQKITLSSSAKINGTYDILSGVKFYLTGDPLDLNIVQGYSPKLPLVPAPPATQWPLGWPNLGNMTTAPQRPELNGGLQISFDGTVWKTFSAVQSAAPDSTGLGDQNDPTTWLLLPAASIGLEGADGVLGPYDIATMYLRLVVPNTATNYKLFDIRLAVDMDIV